jgi:hypothetical protein
MCKAAGSDGARPNVRLFCAGSIGRRNTGGKCLLAFRIQTFWLSLSGRTTLFR